MSGREEKRLYRVDLGGTNMRAGRIVGDRLVAQGTPTQGWRIEKTLEALIEVITFRVGRGCGSYRSIVVPSVVDREKGIVYNVVNIPHWKRYI